MDHDGIARHLAKDLRPEGLNVFTLHTEIEGRHHAPALAHLLKAWSALGWTFETLQETAARAATGEVPVCLMERGTALGRAGWMSAQGS
jgi:hypothetical protein